MLDMVSVFGSGLVGGWWFWRCGWFPELGGFVVVVCLLCGVCCGGIVAQVTLLCRFRLQVVCLESLVW